MPVRETEPRQASLADPEAPRVHRTEARLQVTFAGTQVADAQGGVRVDQQGQAPAYYLRPDDVRRDLLRPSDTVTRCPWKGLASHFDVVVGDRVARDAAWAYPEPNPGYEDIKDRVAFYPARVDACTVDGREASPDGNAESGGWVLEGGEPGQA